MLTFKRVIISLIGLLFNGPALFLIVSAIIGNDFQSDDTWAMLFMGGLLAIAGMTLWWVAYDMGKIKSATDSDTSGNIIAHINNLDDHFDN